MDVAEAQAVREAVRFIKNRRATKAIIESDSKITIEATNGNLD